MLQDFYFKDIYLLQYVAGFLLQIYLLIIVCCRIFASKISTYYSMLQGFSSKISTYYSVLQDFYFKDIYLL